MSAPSQFWLVMRMDGKSISRAHLPHFRHESFESAEREAQRLAALYPAARGFTILTNVGWVNRPSRDAQKAQSTAEEATHV